ncbi:MAG: ABC transporter ATP-binding protein [bacterium]|nr:ABC transporter ATP-binding protein [bacterium]MDD5354262.1 ABC transporter ATP-binding protein [bacterium]MDD5756382.1 ABC transporter ATP-binding protein [bacterium]
MVVVAKNLIKKYKDTMAVNGIEFKVQEKECFGFIGPNGAGKTTTMKMIYCFVPRTSGDLQVLGRDPSIHPELVKANLGVVPQDNNLDEDLNVFTNLTMYANYFDIPKAIARTRAKELLAFVQLTEKEKVKINELSSGMKRRLMIARGLINDPKLLILDEPTVGLDPQARHLIWDRLHELKKQNVSMIITTHYMDEATELCDRIAVMDKGKIMVVGKPKDLIRDHIGEEVVEVMLMDMPAGKLKQDTSGFNVTLEETSQKCYFYCRDCRSLLSHLADKGYKHILRRPATLEDVFLKLTGRDLVD